MRSFGICDSEPLSHDVVVLAKLVALGGSRPPMAQLAADLLMSASQVHASLKRLERSRLIDGNDGRPFLRPVEEFLVHGVKLASPARRGETTRGMPTAHAVPPLNEHIVRSSDPLPVWPSAEGQTGGSTFEPLHKTVPAAAKNPTLYELLALIDAIRDGRIAAHREMSHAPAHGTPREGRRFPLACGRETLVAVSDSRIPVMLATQ